MDTESTSAAEPNVDPKRAALVKSWCDRVSRARKHWEKDFKRIRRDVWFARYAAQHGFDPEQDYVANLVQRHVNTRVAALYAKNPKAVAKRRNRLEYRIWDGKPQSAMQAQQALMPPMPDPMTGMVPPPVDPQTMMQAMALLADIQQGLQRKALLDKLGKTLEILFENALHEQEPNAKIQLKQLVRRVLTTGLGYCKLGFRRLYERDPEVEAEIADVTNRLAMIERMATEVAEGEYDDDAPEMESLRLQLQALTEQVDVLAVEGIVLGFPRATEIIVDPKVRHLKGFIGADWIAHEMNMPASRVREVWGVDVSKTHRGHIPLDANRAPEAEEGGDGKTLCTVWEVQSKTDGMVFTICDGHPDFLEEPRAPDLNLKRFWNIFTLIFNEVEADDGEKPSTVYPPSDVALIRPMQEEFNRARQGLREHRVANRPKYLNAGNLEEEELDSLEQTPAHGIINIKGMAAGQKSVDLLAPMVHSPIDPSLYDTSPLLQDIERTAGSQDANLGAASGDTTATEAGIAETTRLSSVASNIDDLDDFLSEVAEVMGHVMLNELSTETVQRIAGPGAVWPQFSAQDIADDIYLEIKAGSSGRPNKALELANFERAAPYLIQIPGIDPTWLARTALERLDDGLDLEGALVEGLPSIVAMNSMSNGPAAGAPAGPGGGGGGGDPQNDPAAQGGQGRQNAPAGPGSAPGAQPAFPQPGAQGF